MDTNLLLYITLMIYVLIMGISLMFNIKWLLMVVGILWFVPMIEIDNMFITLISAIMIIVHGLLGLYEKKDEDFR